MKSINQQQIVMTLLMKPNHWSTDGEIYDETFIFNRTKRKDITLIGKLRQ